MSKPKLYLSNQHMLSWGLLNPAREYLTGLQGHHRQVSVYFVGTSKKMAVEAVHESLGETLNMREVQVAERGTVAKALYEDAVLWSGELYVMEMSRGLGPVVRIYRENDEIKVSHFGDIVQQTVFKEKF